MNCIYVVCLCSLTRMRERQSLCQSPEITCDGTVATTVRACAGVGRVLQHLRARAESRYGGPQAYRRSPAACGPAGWAFGAGTYINSRTASVRVAKAYFASSQMKVVAYSATVIIKIEGCGTGMSKLLCDDVWFLCGCFQFWFHSFVMSRNTEQIPYDRGVAK